MSTTIEKLKGPSAVKIQFLKSIFEDDFVERGMTAWFVAYEYDNQGDSWKLFFNFEEFEEENNKYFRRVYRESNRILEKVAKGLVKKNSSYTALEADNYQPEYSVFYSAPGDSKDEEVFLNSLSECFQII
jgi:hypothetical protein